MTPFGFQLLAEDGSARRGRLATAHGTIETPAFMTVGTAGTVKGLQPQEVAATGAENASPAWAAYTTSCAGRARS